MDTKMYRKELEQFQQISSERDFTLFTADKISYLDYYRLDYLLITLGLDWLELDFAQRHDAQFRERRNQHEAVDCGDWELLQKWEDEFLDNITDIHIRREIQKRFQEDS